MKKIICSLLFFISLESRANYISMEIPIYKWNNDRLFLHDFSGYTMLLYFFFVNSKNTIKEIQSLDILQKDFEHLPFKVILISEDKNKKKVAALFKKYKIKYLSSYFDNNRELLDDASIINLPSAVLINDGGMIISKFQSPIIWHDNNIRMQIILGIKTHEPLPANTYYSSSSKKR